MSSFALGDVVLYHDRRKDVYRKAVVVNIDRTVHPPSYTITFSAKNDRVTRDTEEHRLLPWPSTHGLIPETVS